MALYSTLTPGSPGESKPDGPEAWGREANAACPTRHTIEGSVGCGSSGSVFLSLSGTVVLEEPLEVITADGRRVLAGRCGELPALHPAADGGRMDPGDAGGLGEGEDVAHLATRPLAGNERAVGKHPHAFIIDDLRKGVPLGGVPFSGGNQAYSDTAFGVAIERGSHDSPPAPAVPVEEYRVQHCSWERPALERLPSSEGRAALLAGASVYSRSKTLTLASRAR